MTIQEISTKFDSVLKDLTGESLGNIMAGIGNSALYKINTRITKTGIDAEGSPYRPYSTKDMLVGDKTFRAKDSKGFFNNANLEWKSLRKDGSKGKLPKGQHLKKSDYWRLAVLKGGYKKFREISDLQSGFVDFAFSNRMWRSIGIISSSSEQNYGTVIIGVIPGGDSELSKKKLEGNVKRRTSILKLSKGELAELTNEFDTEFEKILVKNGIQ
jgi:hypothetical protein